MNLLLRRRAARLLALCVVSVAYVCFVPARAVFAQVPNSLSTHGLPGLVNTPNAGSIPTGAIEFNLNSMPDYQRLLGDARSNFAWQANFQFAFGLWDRLVIGGRGTEVRAKEPWGVFLHRGPDGDVRFIPQQMLTRDLSGNAQLLLVRESRLLPSIAVGLQDFGGAVVNLRGRFAVASKTISDRIRVSAGYGLGPNVLDGVFGGIELAPIPELALVAEYDSERFNTALRLQPMPQHLVRRGFPQPTVDVMWAESEGVSWGVGFRMPLDQGLSPDAESADPAAMWAVNPEDSGPGTAHAISTELIRVGFENVVVRYAEDSTLLIEYENRVYNQTQLDGIAAALTVAEALAFVDTERVQLVLKNQDLPFIVIEIPLKAIAQLRSGQRSAASIPGLSVRWATRGEGSHAGQNRTFGRVDLEVLPLIENFAYSELGVLEGRLNLITTARVQVARGTTIDVGVHSPVAQTPDYFLKGGPLGDPGFQRIVLRHTRRVPTPVEIPLWVEWSAGRFGLDHVGIRQQTEFSLAEGRVRLGTDLAWMGVDAAKLDQTLALGTLTVSIPQYESLVSLTGGRFLFEDWGVAGAFSRFFGDTQISLFLRHSNLASQAGLGFTIPLSFRRDLRPGRFRPRLTSAWRQEQRTTLFVDYGNPLRSDVTRSLPASGGLGQIFFDRGRLTPAWIRSNLGASRLWRP
jgi:Exopolysaccharide biosynthesis protein YbjH